ncbi:hypothetical protein [Aegicerativicinus sediminis]|uniref:hypothetical protein n=1 Tax=Aegicerativicinus sediminis TaxID=2893202 RepID=UPI001E2E8C47|nr:hypothetical protein [Aegicerativicinus sediminis]
MSDTKHLKLENVYQVAKGDSNRILKYLEQFKVLIPERLEQLNLAMSQKNRLNIRQVLHKMSPQLQFFGITDQILHVQRLEFEYETMPFSEIEVLVDDIIIILEEAVNEATAIIDQGFE